MLSDRCITSDSVVVFFFQASRQFCFRNRVKLSYLSIVHSCLKISGWFLTIVLPLRQAVVVTTPAHSGLRFGWQIFLQLFSFDQSYQRSLLRCLKTKLETFWNLKTNTLIQNWDVAIFSEDFPNYFGKFRLRKNSSYTTDIWIERQKLDGLHRAVMVGPDLSSSSISVVDKVDRLQSVQYISTARWEC